jgi:thiol:disulfide interchange protein
MRRLLALALLVFASMAHAETPSLPWQKWDASLFDRAAREDKYILLHMAAVWCHWCHVMERTTYRDPAIQQRIAEKFIAVRVDQDADPALSYRYENWGWPATIMLGDHALLEAAVRALDWTLAHRRAPNGGLGHGRPRRRHASGRHARPG